jgi:DNA polymerase (family X)
MSTKKSYTNAEIAEFLTNIATVYEIKNKNRFRIISYQNAADNIMTYPESVFDIWQKDKKLLDDIPGIGESIQKKLDYLFTHHQPSPKVAQIFEDINSAIFVFTKINGIGPKIAYKLTKNLKFTSKDPIKLIEQLIQYANEHKIKVIETLGEKSESMILENALNFLGRKKRMEYKTALNIADKIINYLQKKFPDTEFISLGSLRRCSQTVGDIDIAAKSLNASEIIDYFVSYPESLQTIVQGPKKASIRIKNDVRIDIMVQPPKSFGSLLQHFTGSRQHNILLRRYAIKLGYSLSEYGIKNLKTGKINTFDNEKDFYNFLKLCYIDPCKRLGEDEIETAQKCYNK